MSRLRPTHCYKCKEIPRLKKVETDKEYSEFKIKISCDCVENYFEAHFFKGTDYVKTLIFGLIRCWNDKQEYASKYALGFLIIEPTKEK